MTEFRNLNGNVLIITEINGQLIASYNLEESFVLDGFSLNRAGVATPVPAEELDTLAEPATSDWQEWSGGQCPIPKEKRIRVRMRNDYEKENYAAGFRWDHKPENHRHRWADIVAYRLIDPPEPTASDWQEWAGGECPFLKDEQICVRLRSGTELKGDASGFEWQHESVTDNGDIIAYKRLR